jgi:hypothetical protein
MILPFRSVATPVQKVADIVIFVSVVWRGLADAHVCGFEIVTEFTHTKVFVRVERESKHLMSPLLLGKDRISGVTKESPSHDKRPIP